MAYYAYDSRYGSGFPRRRKNAGSIVGRFIIVDQEPEEQSEEEMNCNEDFASDDERVESDEESGGSQEDDEMEEEELEKEEAQPKEPGEPCSYSFRSRDRVWVKYKGRWYSGTVLRESSISTSEKTYYRVVFHYNVEMAFSPLDGNIKPDTPYILKLLQDAGEISS